MTTPHFPHVRVKGTPVQRGLQLGQQAARLIRRNLELYRDIFMHYAGWDWQRVTQYAARFRSPIADYQPRYVTEMEGIADGAGVGVNDILALNVRTEIMFAAIARQASAECTSFAILPDASADAHTLIGQNWDWNPAMTETMIVLEAEQTEAPSFVTVVEAGMLAKVGFNSAGIGVATNALISDQDHGEPGVPYHVVLRGLLDAETMTQALAAINPLAKTGDYRSQPRASSANYLVAHRDGEAFDAETAPGDFTRVYPDFTPGDILTHTNHFVCPRFDLKDVGLWNGPDSPFRLARLTRLLWQEEDDLSPQRMQTVLSDHFNHPHSICRHPDPSKPLLERYATIASVIMDLTTRTMWLAAGNPCQVAYQELDYSATLG
jgi:isopenicillin-N N-acyltransferase-like protein